jgi:hypothetical protein
VIVDARFDFTVVSVGFSDASRSVNVLQITLARSVCALAGRRKTHPCPDARNGL